MIRGFIELLKNRNKEPVVSPNNLLTNAYLNLTAPAKVGVIERLIRQITSPNVSPDNILVHARFIETPEESVKKN